MKAILAATILMSSSMAFAGGHPATHKQQPATTASIAGAHSASEAKANAAALASGGYSSAAGGSGSSDNSVNFGGSRTFAIGAASAPSPTRCVIVLPELFGAFTAWKTNRLECGIAVAEQYIMSGKEDKGVAILDRIARELELDK